MKNSVNTLIKISLLLSLGLGGFANADAAVPGGIGDQAILQDIDKSIPANAFAVTKMLSYAYFSDDPFFPLIPFSGNGTQNSMGQAQQIATSLTQSAIKNQLMTIPFKISNAYTNLSPARMLSLPNPDNNKIYDLTYGTPSYDTMYLPYISCTSDTCALKPNAATAEKNAANFNFDTLLGPNNYGKEQQTAAQNYITYALQTYSPLVNSESMDSAPGSDGGSKQNQSFFQALNDYLQNNPKDANNFLVKSVLKNQDFQKFWLELRSYEAKRSLLLSNFNYLQAERTPQKNLGRDYGLSNSDASQMEVENALVNNSIQNPAWYKSMKTASPATIAREQLLLTSLLLRIQYHNQQINERNLSTLTLLTDALMQQQKVSLTAEEVKLKNEILPSAKN